MTHSYSHDVLIIGSGASGLSLALKLADTARIAILSKGDFTAANTFYAQGGIAAVMDKTDSVQAHIQDTLNSGAGLCDEKAVRFTVENGPEAMQWLIDQGMNFTKTKSGEGEEALHLTQEGGHTHRRILHAADATGLEISKCLMQQAQAHPNIEFFNHRIAVDLITTSKLNLPGHHCLGAYVLNQQSDQVETFKAKCVALATGGASKAYLYTTNPDVATGDGIAMAWRAGCTVSNMEFNQFHPTCLYHPKGQSFLISEALRGEGAILRLPNGESFMQRFDPRAELAPRDIVARAIDHEMKRLGAHCLYLDISHKPLEFIQSHFPTIYEKCLSLNIDISREPIPIVPAAHYTCGGVLTDLQGATSVSRLYALGETACTGLHGANRMASNSLLECLVFAFSAAKKIQRELPLIECIDNMPVWDESQVTDSDEDVVITHNWYELRRLMWDYVGIVRTTKRLQRAKRRVDLLAKEISEYYSNYKISSDLIELRNLVVVADLIICSALQRRESRGLHYTLDYPELLLSAENTVLKP